jgi:hypothetical protein
VVAEMQFQTSYDSTAKGVSAFVAAILVFVVILTQGLLAAVLGLAILLLAFAWSPRGFTVHGPVLLVHRLAGTVRIPLEGIREIRPAAGDDYQGAIRLFGNGGLFGYYGLFRTTKLGKCTWYLTNQSNAVVIVTSAKTVLVSPDDVEAFLAAVRSAVPIAPGPSAVSAAFPMGRSYMPLLVAGIVTVFAVAIGTGVTLYSPGTPDYTLNATSLTIRDRFYPITLQAKGVDIKSVRVVNLDSDADWRPAGRTNGFANKHYRSGNFRTASGLAIRLYQADSKRLVLLPPNGSGVPVLLEAHDPDRLVSDVMRKWRQ